MLLREPGPPCGRESENGGRGVIAMNKDVAGQINEMMLRFGAELDQSVELVQKECDETELVRYRRAVGKIMGEMLLEVMNPIYEAHPDLKPPELE
jgi:hypothetical protein